MKTWTVRISMILLAIALAVLANSCMPFNPLAAAGVGDLKLYWVTNAGAAIAEKVQSSLLDGTGVQTHYSDTNSHSYSAIAVDKLNGKIYWADSDPGVMRIFWCNLDGSGKAPIISATAYALAVDAVGGKLYYSSGAGAIFRCDLDGQNNQQILFGAPMAIKEIELDLANNLIYWVEDSIYIYKSVISDSLSRTPLFAATGTIGAIALDSAGGIIYWHDGMALFKSPVSSYNPQNLGSIMANDIEVDPHEGYLYYSTNTAATGVRVSRLAITGGSMTTPVNIMDTSDGATDIFLDLWP